MRPSPTRDKLIAIIERRGYISAHDLFEETGVKSGGQDTALQPLIARGVIRVEANKNHLGRGRAGRAYRWVGEKPRHDPTRPGQRTCLCCHQEFRSDSAANRICPACKIAANKNGGGRFDEPAVVRYH